MFALCILVIITVWGFFSWKYRDRIKIYNIVLLTFFMYLLANVRETPDISNYIFAYYQDDYTFKDAGFKIVCNFFKGYGLDYYQFQTIYFLMAICIVSYALLRLSEKRTMIYILYALFPFLYNSIQIRNFFVLAMITLAFSLSATIKKPMRIIAWILCVIIAATQHVLALSFLPFAFVIDKKQISIKIMQVMCVVTLVFMFVPNSGVLSLITNIIGSLADDHRALKYTVRSTNLGQYVMIGRSLLMMGVVYFARKKVERTVGNREKSCELEAINIAENLMIFGSLFWPLYVLNGNFTRIMQDESIIIYYVITVLYSMYRRTQSNNSRLRITISTATVLSVFLITYNIISLWILNYETVVKPILSFMN